MNVYSLSTPLERGQYQGLSLEDVYRDHPSYIETMLLEDSLFSIDEIAIQHLFQKYPNNEMSPGAIGQNLLKLDMTRDDDDNLEIDDDSLNDFDDEDLEDGDDEDEEVEIDPYGLDLEGTDDPFALIDDDDEDEKTYLDSDEQDTADDFAPGYNEPDEEDDL